MPGAAPGGGNPVRQRNQPPGERLGAWALSFGVAACVGAFLPMIGEFLGAPAALLAITLGLVGIRRFETGRASRLGPAATGAALGASALVVIVFMFIATNVPSRT
jgi:hypothetical protein